MSDLTSMKRQPKMGPDCWSAMDQMADDYGYGLSINLDKDQCAALGLTDLPAPGTPVMIRAVGVVTRTSVVNDGDADDPERSLSVQLTDLALDTPGAAGDTADSAASLLYGG
ncbi:MAG: hypothetical protein EPN31_06245 [Castellaniella sp.]|uniref:capsid staple protein n=1 Tax=Castellaniella sp. TaxID=1955812 RepID=UPI001204CB0A|nr:hypothetical protein [Castellaniella sp.]TAN29583.1 MAG: hypothetical protein EPN31_06245 [Castellaniella sp.]